VFLPEFSGVAVYLLMAIILLWRPQGLFRGV
jgi:branched-subunit amino acid ABC-type transport system permease component